MPDFIYARGTFYPIAGSSDSVYLCDSEEAAFSFLKVDYSEVTHVDGLTICHQRNADGVAEKFRAWGQEWRLDWTRKKTHIISVPL